MKRKGSVDAGLFYSKKSKQRHVIPSRFNMGRARRSTVRDFTSAPPSYKVRNSKAVSVKRVRKVKVSSKLKAKITKVINEKVKHVSGSYTDNFQGIAHAASDRQQQVFNLPGWSAFHFTTNEFLNAASVLFNGKPSPSSPLPYYAPAAVNNFSQKNVQIEVKNSYSYYNFKNGTQHAIQLTLCVCVPKKKGANAEWDQDATVSIKNDGSSNPNPQAVLAPRKLWEVSLAEDFTNQYVLQGFMPGTVNNAAPSLTNPSIEDMWRRPTESPTFNNTYKVEYVSLLLQPGTMVRHKIQGPRDIMIDYSKLYQQDTLLNVQKYSRAVMGIMINTPNSLSNVSVSTGLGVVSTPGRWADKLDTLSAGFGLFVERTNHFSIRLPEQTGFQFPQVTQFSDISLKQQVLGMRRPRAIVNNHFLPHPNAAIGQVQEVIDLAVMNPQAPISKSAE